jgi:hypothetical protein
MILDLELSERHSREINNHPASQSLGTLPNHPVIARLRTTPSAEAAATPPL